MFTVIRDAIRRRHLLLINYDPGHRIVEPHAFGESKDGNQLLRAFQVSGASLSNEHVNWKLFRVDRAISISLHTETFNGPRPDYNRDDKAMKGRIIEQL